LGANKEEEGANTDAACSRSARQFDAAATLNILAIAASNIPMNEEMEIAMRPSDGPEILRKFIDDVVAQGGDIVAYRSEHDKRGAVMLFVAEFLPGIPPQRGIASAVTATL
jgi:hypothetical protein